jgi:hypothetical protein
VCVFSVALRTILLTLHQQIIASSSLISSRDTACNHNIKCSLSTHAMESSTLQGCPVSFCHLKYEPLQTMLHILVNGIHFENTDYNLNKAQEQAARDAIAGLEARGFGTSHSSRIHLQHLFLIVRYNRAASSVSTPRPYMCLPDTNHTDFKTELNNIASKYRLRVQYENEREGPTDRPTWISWILSAWRSGLQAQSLILTVPRS